MGSLSYRRQPLTLAQLVASSPGIALVRPAAPPRVTVRRTAARPPDAPTWLGAAAVDYAAAFDRHQIIAWLRAPSPAPPLIEVAAPENEAAARDAHDAALGMLGHVHHLVIQVDLDVPAAWREQPDDRRLVFVAPLPPDADAATPPRFALVHDAVLGPAALDAVRALLPPPPRPARARRWPWLIAAAVVLGALTLLLTRGPA